MTGQKQPTDFRQVVILTHSHACDSCFTFSSVVFVLGQLFTAAYS